MTELGQSQLTLATLDVTGDGFFSSADDDSSDFGWYEGECQACDIFQRLDDLGLCQECAAKLEHDLIRQRDWNYTISGFAAGPAEREEIRKKVIKVR